MTQDMLTTLAGMALGFLGVFQLALPQDAPWWAHALVGGLVAAIGVPLGYTHSKGSASHG